MRRLVICYPSASRASRPITTERRVIPLAGGQSMPAGGSRCPRRTRPVRAVRATLRMIARLKFRMSALPSIATEERKYSEQCLQGVKIGGEDGPPAWPVCPQKRKCGRGGLEPATRPLSAPIQRIVARRRTIGRQFVSLATHPLSTIALMAAISSLSCTNFSSASRME
jgi:hypothetical protein